MDVNNPLIDHFPGEEVLFTVMGLDYDELFRYGIKFTADVDGTKDSLNQFFTHFWDNAGLKNRSISGEYQHESLQDTLKVICFTINRQCNVSDNIAMIE